MTDLVAYLGLSAILLIIGGLCVLLRSNALLMLMGVELMLNSANLALVGFSRQFGDPGGQVFAFLVMIIAAAEVAIGLALIVLLFRSSKRIDADEINLLKG